MSPQSNSCQEGYHWVEEHYRGTSIVEVYGYLHGDSQEGPRRVGAVWVQGHWAKNPVRKHGVKA